MDKTALKNLLRQHNLHPNKLMGQNFLVDRNVLEKIIQAADLQPNDTVLEIGSGLGTLTKELAQRAKKVITVEKDKNLVLILRQELINFKNVKIIQGDILKIQKLKTSAFAKTSADKKNYKIIANIPYYLTSHLIKRFLKSKTPPQEMTLMVQKEVGQRICAKPPKTNLLAVTVQFYAQPQIVSYVSRASFLPQPKVDSAIIKISDIQKPKNIDSVKFFKLVKASFSSPRKQLANNLSQKLKIEREEIKAILKKNNLNPEIRAEALSMEDWKKLCLSFL